jgi:hypothetical protein
LVYELESRADRSLPNGIFWTVSGLLPKLFILLSPSSYALVFTDGSAPSGDLDTSFFDDLDLEGYVPASGRGTVSGTYSGTSDGLDVTIGFKV